MEEDRTNSLRFAIIDQRTGIQTNIVAPTGVPIQKLLPVLVKQLRLPQERAGGILQEYYLAIERDGVLERLTEDETLANAGIAENALIRIMPIMYGDYARSSPYPIVNRIKFPVRGSTGEETIADDKPTKLRVAIIDQRTGTKTNVIAPSGIPIQKLLPALVKQLGLPAEGTGGTTQEYYLAVERDGEMEKLEDAETLAAAGVTEHALLRIVPLLYGGHGGFSTYDETYTCDIFVIMPFTNESDVIYIEAIKPVARDLGLIALRADDLFSHHEITQRNWSEISRARVVVADCTGRDANVFYNLGIAHAIGKDMILLAQEITRDIPLDLQSREVIAYEAAFENTEALRARLERALCDTLNIVRSDSK